MTEPKQATSRQRSAFSDAVEILNELHHEGISTSEIAKAMEWTGLEIHSAGVYLTRAGLMKMVEEEND